MTIYVTALAVFALVCGIAFVILPSLGYPTVAAVAFALFLTTGALFARSIYRHSVPHDEIREPEMIPEPMHESIVETEAANEAYTSEGDMTMRTVFAAIAILAGVSSYVTAAAIFAVYVLTYSVIEIPGTTFSFSLLKYGLFGLGAYAFLNVIDALTPQTSARLNNFGRNAARFALVVISISTIMTVMQFGLDLDRIKTVFREDYSIAVLFLTLAYAWFDATLLQLIKNWSLHRNTTMPAANPVRDPVITDEDQVQRTLASFGIHMTDCKVAVVDARGQNLVITIDDNVQVRTETPGAAHAA